MCKLTPLAELDSLNINDYWGCPCCDLLVKKEPLNYHQKARCPRCNVILAGPIDNSIEKTLALSIGAIILFFPAIFLPLMTLNLIGLSQQQSIVQSILAIYNEGYLLVSGIILLTCIIVPLLKITILFYVSLTLTLTLHKRGRGSGKDKNKKITSPWVVLSFRIYHFIEEWAMLEIYMLAIIVSVVKLEVIADLHFNLGLVLFAGLLLFTLLSSVFLDENFFWEKIDNPNAK